MTTALILFLSTCGLVFFLGLQSLVLHARYRVWAMVNSLAISYAQLQILRLAPDSTGWETAGYFLGGPVGILLAMELFDWWKRSGEEWVRSRFSKQEARHESAPLPELKKGQVLVLVGPQGSGKTRLAREIANQHGGYVEIEAEDFEAPWNIGEVMASEPSTVIFDGKMEAIGMRNLKLLVTNSKVRCNTKGRPSFLTAAPNVIWCTGEIDPILIKDGDRRFQVVRVGGEITDRSTQGMAAKLKSMVTRRATRKTCDATG